jgi:UDP-N-acetylmuramate dehydrogenase
MMEGQTFREKLSEEVEGEVFFDEPMDRYTSIRVGGKADVLVCPQSVEALRRVILYCRSCNKPFLPVGNWTNLIVRDGGYRGVIISMKRLQSVTWDMGRKGSVLVSAQAGVSLAEVVRMAARDAFTGMEFCSGIPGSIGGAVIMNAGAYGKEIRDVIQEVTLMNERGEIVKRKKKELSFEYRKLNLPEETIVVGAAFSLEKGDPVEIRERVAEILEKRRQKHPLEYPNAGSIFKNPKSKPAGQIIEEAGLRGVRIGDAKISEKHGNFIVNLGNARAADIVALIDLAKKKVREQMGISLETEVRIIGE